MYAKICYSIASENIIENHTLKSKDKKAVNEVKKLIANLNKKAEGHYTLLEICDE